MRNLSSAQDEFFVGYASRIPAGVARHVRWGIVIVFVSVLGAAAVVAGAFGPAGRGEWSDQPGAFSGQLIEKPYPMLRMAREGRVERVLLVAPGKHGAASLVAGLDGEGVRVWGTLLRRNGRSMIELAESAGGGQSDVLERERLEVTSVEKRSLGRMTVTGEIIDPKCYLGAMKPGDGKVHKACAIRCIAGGIPPVLLAAEREGSQDDAGDSQYLLVSASGDPLNKRVLPFVGESVEVTGVVEVVDGMRMLRVDDTGTAISRSGR